MFWRIIIFLPILGVYELATFQMKPGGPALWGDPFKRAVHTHVNRGYTKLVGVFHAEYGVLNRGTVSISSMKLQNILVIHIKFLWSVCLCSHYGVYFIFYCPYLSFL